MQAEGWPNNRGVAIKDGWLVRGTSDGYLVALNAESGEVVWARRVADSSKGETFTMAPLMYEDLILIGPVGSENGFDGYARAHVELVSSHRHAQQWNTQPTNV